MNMLQQYEGGGKAPRRLAFAGATAFAEIVDRKYISTIQTLIVPILNQWSEVLLPKS